MALNNLLMDTKNFLMEASDGEVENFDPLIDDTISKDFDDIFDDIPELDIDIFYSTESVSMYKQGEYYLVETDTLSKFADSNNIDSIEDAIKSLADFNKISVDEVALVVESEDYYKACIEEAKVIKDKSTKKKKLKGVKNSTNFLKDALDKGIKIFKKKKQRGNNYEFVS